MNKNKFNFHTGKIFHIDQQHSSYDSEPQSRHSTVSVWKRNNFNARTENERECELGSASCDMQPSVFNNGGLERLLLLEFPANLFRIIAVFSC